MKLTNFITHNLFSNLSSTSVLIASLITLSPALADNYTIDNGGAHSSIQFKISHLGYSWLWGRFNDFEGNFNYDNNNSSNSNVEVTVNAASIDTNHAELDKHLRTGDFLEIDKYPNIKFVSTQYTETNKKKGKLKGNLSFHGVTREIEIDLTHVGAGKDPWGGYRRGFEGSTRIALADYGIKKNLGPASAELDLIISLEGIKK